MYHIQGKAGVSHGPGMDAKQCGQSHCSFHHAVHSGSHGSAQWLAQQQEQEPQLQEELAQHDASVDS